MVHMVLIWCCCVYIVLINTYCSPPYQRKWLVCFYHFPHPFTVFVSRVYSAFLYMFLAFIFLTIWELERFVCVCITVSRITFLRYVWYNTFSQNCCLAFFHRLLLSKSICLAGSSVFIFNKEGKIQFLRNSRAPGWVLKEKKTRPNYNVQQGILKLREMRAKKQSFFVRENELFLRISEYSIFFNAFKRKVDWNGLQKSHLEFSCDFGEESVYVRGLWSILAIFLCIATAALICGQMMTPLLKLLWN